MNITQNRIGRHITTGIAAVIMTVTTIAASVAQSFAAESGTEVEKSNGVYLVKNEPYHSVTFNKKSSYDGSMLDGAVFHLTGTSDKGTVVDKYAVSGVASGTVPGWVPEITDTGQKDTITNILKFDNWTKDNAYTIQTAIQTAMQNGTYGNSKSDGSVTGMAGTVTFDTLEQGSYVLQEVSAPTIYWYNESTGNYTTDQYESDTTNYAVTIEEISDGSIITMIDGLSKDAGGTYELYNTKKSGTVVIKKIWDDAITNHVPVPLSEDGKIITISEKDYAGTFLGVTISTTKEEWDGKYRLILDAAGGTFKYSSGNTEITELVFDSNWNLLEGEYIEPVKEGYSIPYWKTADGATYTLETYQNAFENAKTVRMTAVWQKADAYKYAVQVYGINTDTLEDGSTGGLTFGPAIGESFISSYNSHTPTGSTDSSHSADGKTHEHRCIHNDSWETIIEWNNTDPDVYEQCISGVVDSDGTAHPCTKSVPLTLTDANSSSSEDADKVFNKSYEFAYAVTGDGYGTLYNIINKQSRQWASASDSNLNWANSKIRAVLNGPQNETNKKISGSTWAASSVTYFAEASSFGGSNSILSAFPESLRNVIGKKAVTYATSYKTSSSVNTVYDKLWLPSAKEAFGDIVQGYESNNYNYSEGTQYKRATLITSYDKARAWSDYKGGTADWFSLRSRCARNYGYAAYVRQSGGLGYASVDRAFRGISPCFVLERAD